MTIGANAGGQLNILIFEVGMVTTMEVLGIQTELTQTVSVHPLLVVPTRIRYTDASRSAITQTARGSVKTQGSRALRRVVLEGTFGVEPRGLLFYLGNGDIRFQRFYKEVVRMSGALSQDQVDAATDILQGTPGIPLLVAAYDEDHTLFYVNFYDFWNDIAFEGEVMDFTWTREHRQAGATGAVWYTMTLQEVGPLVEGGLGNTIISALMAGLTLWSDVNDVLTSYTLTNILDSIVGVAAIFTSQLEQTLKAVQAQIDAIQNLLGSEGGFATASSSDGIAEYLRNCEALARAADELAATMGRQRREQVRAARGGVDWGGQVGEGGSAELERHSQRLDLLELADRARQQASMGAYLGMSREEFATWLTAGAAETASAPEIGATREHVVTDTDTAASIEAAYGVSWQRILALNRLTPDEALLTGTGLLVPRIRPRGSQGVEGLPTFGSHVGQEAWGSDLLLELLVVDGRLATVSGPAVLKQGVAFVIEEFGDELLRGLQVVPPRARASYLRRRISGLLASDQRVAAVTTVEVGEDRGGAVEVAVSLRAINGGSIMAQTGSAA